MRLRGSLIIGTIASVMGLTSLVLALLHVLQALRVAAYCKATLSALVPPSLWREDLQQTLWSRQRPLIQASRTRTRLGRRL
jgi:hypothetical protein